MKPKLFLAFALVVFVLLATISTVQPTVAQGGCTDRYEPNDNQLRELTSGQIQATICPAEDIDNYFLKVSKGDRILLRLSNLPADYDMQLVDNGAPLAISDNGGTSNEEITWVAKADGVLYVVIWGFDNTSSTSPYTFSINVGKQSYDAREIRFSVSYYYIKALNVIGKNQYGEMTTWKSPFYSQNHLLIQTDKFWWKGTVALEFYITGVGWRKCVIDNLNILPTTTNTPVRYTMGQGCSGDSGSGAGNNAFAEGLYDAISLKDAHGVSEAISQAHNKASCLQDLATGFASPSRVIRVSVSCGGVALDRVNAIVGQYNKVVEMATVVSNANRGSVNFDNYCAYEYGSGAYSVMADRWDAYSWSCQRSSQYVGGLNMGEACREQYPNLPIAVMGNRWDANSWYCTR